MSSSGQPEEPGGEILSHGRGCGQDAAPGRGAVGGLSARTAGGPEVSASGGGGWRGTPTQLGIWVALCGPLALEQEGS